MDKQYSSQAWAAYLAGGFLLVLLTSEKDLALRTQRVRFTHRSKRSTFASLMPQGKIAVAQANLRLEKGKSEDDESARHRFIAGRTGLRERLDHPREKREHGLAILETIEPDAKLFALAEHVDFAEKAFHDALVRRNEAQIAYLRQPNILSRKAFEAAKNTESIALEILDTEVRRLASTRATTVIGLKLKASYASTEAKLADSIIVDILQL